MGKAIMPEQTQRQRRGGVPMRARTFSSFVRRRTSQRFETKVMRNSFRLYWCVFVLLHTIDGLFLAGVTKLYYWMLYQPVVMVTVQMELHLLPIATLRSLVWVFPVLSAGHLLTVVETLVYSVQQRQLALTYDEDDLQAASEETRRSPAGVHSMMSKATRKLQSFLAHRVYPYVTLDGKHFEIWFTIQEIVQIGSQTYQCYSMSRLVTTKWMNDLAVLCMFLNCVSSSVIRFAVPHDIPRQRFLCVLVDCCMGFVQAVVIPFTVFYRYYRVYDTGEYYFPEELAYNSVWYVEAIHNLDQIFIVSYLDFVTTAVPHVDCLRSLREISQWLRPIDTGKAQIVLVNPKRTTPKNNPSIRAVPSWPNNQSWASRAKKRSSLFSLYSVLCILYGVGIVGVHLAASNNDPIASESCLSHPNPWITQRFACSLININCYRSEIRGESNQVTSILQLFDAPTTSILIFSHCAELEIPPILSNFSALIGLNMFNSTLVQWSSNAAINSGSHPVFNYWNAGLLRLAGIPDGLLGDDLPATFTDVELYGTNLSALPVEIGTKWFNLNCLYLEFSQLTQLPASLDAMPLWYFSAIGNQIDSIADQVFANGTFSQFLMSNNPLAAFPASIGELSDTCALMLAYTRIQEVPMQVVDWALDRWAKGVYIAHSLYGSPFCANVTASTSSRQDQEEEEEKDSRLALYKELACLEDEASSYGYFPIDIMRSQLPL